MRAQDLIKEQYTWEDLLAIVDRLRDKENGCPWDSVQTYESMKKCMTDETQEVVEAVDNKDIINLCEEVGDVLLSVLMYAKIAAEQGDFSLEDVIDGLAKKLVRRHPHVFADGVEAETPEEGLSLWKSVKIKEKLDKLQVYERYYKQGKIPLEVLEQYREKCRQLQAEKK